MAQMWLDPPGAHTALSLTDTDNGLPGTVTTCTFQGASTVLGVRLDVRVHSLRPRHLAHRRSVEPEVGVHRRRIREVRIQMPFLQDRREQHHPRCALPRVVLATDVPQPGC